MTATIAVSSSIYGLASSKFAVGTRINEDPAFLAAITFCFTPPTGPTEPSISIVPVPATLMPFVKSS